MIREEVGTMGRQPTSFEEATKMYTDYFGKAPTIGEITKLYNIYMRCWRACENFMDWMAFAIDTEEEQNHGAE